MFNEIFNIDENLIKDYGAVNISLVADIPLFVDPILIFNSEKQEYKQLHESIIEYLCFLSKKAQNDLTPAEIKTWFSFNEICNNWLGFSKSSNKGLGLDKKFANLLYRNIGFVLNNNGISSSIHIEKIMLLEKGQGKDKISDLTVNLIKGYLCEYTEKFAQKYLMSSNQAKVFRVDNVEFNYKTECFVSKEYYLPYIINKKGEEEFVLLTPSDILRKDEQAINRTDFLRRYKEIRNAIDNDVLRAQVDNYLQRAIYEYREKCRTVGKKSNEKAEEKIVREAFEEVAKQFPQIYDYYVKLIEEEKGEIINTASNEVCEQTKKFVDNVHILVDLISNGYRSLSLPINAFEETVHRVKFIKDLFENKGAYKLFYNSRKDKVMYSSESDLQLLFKFVWHATFFRIDAEVNNGDGPADFVVSYGANDSCVVEFKLASNKKLKNVFPQTNTYKQANNTKNSIIVIFYFSDKECERALNIIKDKEKENELDSSIFLIDCRNRESASNRK